MRVTSHLNCKYGGSTVELQQKGSPCVVILPCKDPVKYTGYQSNLSNPVFETLKNVTNTGKSLWTLVSRKIKIIIKTHITCCIPVQWTGISMYWLRHFYASITGFSLFYKSSDLQGIPCIGYNTFKFQFQGFTCCTNTFFPVLTNLFPCFLDIFFSCLP